MESQEKEKIFFPDLLKKIGVEELKVADLSGDDKILIIEVKQCLDNKTQALLKESFERYSKHFSQIKKVLILESGMTATLKDDTDEKLRKFLTEVCQLGDDPTFKKAQEELSGLELAEVVISNYAEMALKYKKLNEEKKAIMQRLGRNCDLCLTGVCRTVERIGDKAMQDILSNENELEEKKDVQT